MHSGHEISEDQGQLIHHVFQTHPAIMLLVDVESHRFVDANAAACAFYGYSRDELLSKKLTQICHRGEQQLQELMQAFEQAPPDRFPSLHTVSDGTIREVEIQATACQDLQGRNLLLAIVQDVSDREEVKRDLADVRTLYESILTNANEAIFITRDARFEMVNEKLVELMQYSREELLALPSFGSLVHPDDQGMVKAMHLRRLAGDPNVMERYQFRAVSKDGTVKWVDLRAVVIDWSGSPAVLNFVLDINDATETSYALSLSEARFFDFMDHSPGGAVIVDDQFRIVYANRSVKNDLGEDVEGKPLRDRFEPEFAEEYILHFQKVMETGQTLEAIEKHRRGDGSVGYTLAYKFPLTGPTGQRWAGATLLDITDRIRQEKEIIAGKARLEAVMQALPHILYQKDTEGRLVLANQAFADFLQTTPDQLIGKCDTDLMPPDLAESCAASDQQVLQEGLSVQVEERMDLGEMGILYFDTRKVPLKDAEGVITGLLGISIDTTASREAEEALRRSEQDYRGFFENAHDAILIIDPDGEIVLDVNPQACRQYGYTRDEFIGMSTKEVTTNQPKGERYLRLLMEEVDSTTFETVHLRKNGAPMHVTINASWIEFKGKTAILSLNRDITAIKEAEAERRELEERVRLIQKTESLGVLAGGIAHDFNNLLTGIIGNVDLLKLEVAGDSFMEDLVTEITNAAERAADLSRHMLAYSGKGHFIKKHLDLANLLQKMQANQEFAIPEGIELELSVAGDAVRVFADAGQLHQALLQLVNNAVEAIDHDRGRGRVALSLRTEELTEQQLASRYIQDPLPPGHYAILEIHDNGSGIGEEALERLFDPFFSTKFTGRGLGLAAALGIVRGHQGSIQVESELDKGSVFRLFLPVVNGEDANRGYATKRGRDNRKLLLVDDDALVRTVTRKMLERLGYHVETATNGSEAQQLADHARTPYQAILLDMTMPGLPSCEVCDYIKKRMPDSPVLVISGSSVDDAKMRFKGKDVAAFIAKPMTLSKLKDTLSEALQQR